MEKIYGNRSARELDRAGGYFQRHMEHMTSENLNSKGDIALELAHRDMELDALLARHNALREAIHKAMERTVGCDKKQTDDQLIADVAYLKRLASDHFKTSIDCGNRVFAIEQKYDALRDAVAWEREFDEVLVWLVRTGRYPRDMASRYDLANERECARAEVDRLIASQGSADCQGEG